MMEAFSGMGDTTSKQLGAASQGSTGGLRGRKTCMKVMRWKDENP